MWGKLLLHVLLVFICTFEEIVTQNGKMQKTLSFGRTYLCKRKQLFYKNKTSLIMKKSHIGKQISTIRINIKR